MAMPRKAPGGDHCSAIACHNSRYKQARKGISFFRYPRDEERCRKWVQNTRRQDLLGKTASELSKGGYRMCTLHFEPSQFTVPLEKKRLNWNAVPTIFKVPNPPPKMTPGRPGRKERHLEPPQKKQKCFQKGAETAEAPSDDTPLADVEHSTLAATTSSATTASATISAEAEIVSLRKKLRVSRNKIYKLKHKLKKRKAPCSKHVTKKALLGEISKIFPEATAQFFQTQLRAIQKKKRGVRWSETDKTLALSLFHSSPKAYRKLKQVFLLPSVRTLRRALENIEIYPGFNGHILEALSIKLKGMTAGAETCAIIFDEMTIKEGVSYDAKRDRLEGLEDLGPHGREKHAANHALVFMVRGFNTNWKQPVGYFLTSGPIDGGRLRSLILDCIDKVEQAGCNVKVIISDQGSNNRKAITGLGVTEQQHFFHHRGKQIFVMYDPPHLLKNIRNNLKRTGFDVNGREVRWQHIVDFYQFDKKNMSRMAPRLSERHISLPAFSTLKVRYAAQVLSHSVAAGIAFLVQQGVLKEDALPTSQFLEHFDQTFNACNSSYLTSKQVMGHAMSGKSGHVEFLHRCLTWLDQVRSRSSYALPCLVGWKMTIKSLLALWEDLRLNLNFKFLLTDRLNQDCLENFFSKIRGHTGGVYNPTASAFRAILRQVMVDQIFSHSDGSNCEADTSKFLLNLGAMKSAVTASQSQSQEPAVDHPVEPVNEQIAELLSVASPPAKQKDPHAQAAEDNVLMYIAGYIAKKLEWKVCSPCRELLTGIYSGKAEELFIAKKQFDDLSGKGLQIPSAELYNAVQSHVAYAQVVIGVHRCVMFVCGL